MEEIRSVLAIGAHPDDIEIGCGGLLLKLKKLFPKTDIYYLCLTAGELTDKDKVRISEMAESVKKLEVTLLCDPYLSDGFIPQAYQGLVNDLEQFKNDYDFHLVLTHNPYDVHHDHRAVSNATVEAFRNSYADIYFYENMTTPTTFNPNLYVDIDEFMNKKLELLHCFKSQIEKNVIQINPENIEALARFRGAKMYFQGCMEAFEIKKMFYF